MGFLAEIVELSGRGPKSASGYCRRAGEYLRRAKYDKAIADCNEAIRLDPNLASVYSIRALAIRASAHSGKGEFEKAIAHYSEAIRLDPNNRLARYNRGVVYADIGEYDKAIADCTEAIRLGLNRALAYRKRGYDYWMAGEFDKAIEDCTELIRLDSKDATAYANRGAVYSTMGKFDKAIADCTEAIRLDPKNAAAYNNLAWLCASCTDARFRDGPNAIENATRACKLSRWKDACCLGTLAAAYAEAEQFEDAIKWQTKAIGLLPADSDKTALESRLGLYKAGKPYRE